MTSRQDMLDNATPVRIIKAPEELDTLGVEFGSTNTFPVPLIGTAAPVQLLQRRPTRFKAVITLDNLVTALTAVVQIVLGATTVAAYNPNAVGVLQTVSGGTVTAISVNGVLTGVTSGVFYVPAGGSIAVTYTVAPTTFTTAYPPGVTVPATVSTGVLVAFRPDYLANPGNPQGFLMTVAPRIFQWENQQPLYAVALGSGPVNVGIIDQAQSAAQAVAEEATEGEDFPDEQYQEEDPRYAGTRNANQY